MENTVATVIYDSDHFQKNTLIVPLSFTKEFSKFLKPEAHFHGCYRILDTAPFEIIVVIAKNDCSRI